MLEAQQGRKPEPRVSAEALALGPLRNASAIHLKLTVGVGPRAELMGPCLGLDGAMSQGLVLARGLWLWWPPSGPWSSVAPGQLPGLPVG